MTKEELLDSYFNPEGYGKPCITVQNLWKFLESNVCIPKGDTLQIKFDSKWDDKITIDPYCEYRIKPKEPVYEWQWETQIGKVKTTFDYMTDEEALAFEHETSFYGINRKQETQRERK